MAKLFIGDLRLYSPVLLTSTAISQREREEGTIATVHRHLLNIHRWKRARSQVEAMSRTRKDPDRTRRPPCIVTHLAAQAQKP